MRTKKNQKNQSPIMKACMLLFATFFMANIAQASCTFEQPLKGEELPVGIVLTWRTGTETNNSMFIVEKSEDGLEFSNVGTIKAAGTSSKRKDYNFLDATAAGGKVFYRLRQVDFDGTYSETEILPMTKKMVNKMMVVQMSNESTAKEFSFTIDAITEGTATLKIKDAAGQIVLEQKKELINGLNTINIDFADKKEGTYKLFVVLDGEEEAMVVRRVLDDVESKVNVASTKKTDGKNK